MEIRINKQHIVINPEILTGIPDFVVITGENGSGKTQFLRYLMEGDMNGHEVYNEITQEHTYEPGIELLVDGERKTNITMVETNQHSFFLGQHFNEASLNNNYGSLPLKYYSFLNLKRLRGEVEIDQSALNKQFLADTQLSSQRNSQDIKVVTESDVQLLKTIYEKRNRSKTPITLDEVLVNIPLSPTDLFSTNLTFLYLQYQIRLRLNMETDEAPWDTFNKVMASANFKYRLKEPVYDNNIIDTNILLEDIETKNVKNVDWLSSGERTIMSLILALYNSQTDTQFPEVILFDEPDSSLHPAMAQQMLNVMQNVFVKEKNVKVIMTTHSPTTVALAPELSLYKMEKKKGYLVKVNKSEAIKSLTNGLTTISVYFEHKKQIFVEAPFDAFFYENVYNNISPHLNKDIYLQFMPTGQDGSKLSEGQDSKEVIAGGCQLVKDLVNRLYQAGNKTICGLIDWDLKNNGSERIIVLGKKNRYSIENYVFDPILLSIYFLALPIKNPESLGYEKIDNIRTFQTITNPRLQLIVDKIIINLDKHSNATNKTLISYNLINGMTITLPEWFFKMQGHALEKLYLSAFPFLNQSKANNDNNFLKKDIIRRAVNIFPEYLPEDILATFIDLQTISID